MEETAQKLYGAAFYGESYAEPKRGRKKVGIPAANEQGPPRRGPHRSETVGAGMGGGQEAPTPFFHCVLHRILLAALLAQEPFQRLAGFINGTHPPPIYPLSPTETTGVFLSFAPKLHHHYVLTMRDLYRWKDLPKNFAFRTSVFAAATFNFGPRTATFPHLDFANLAWGWCSITALGRFDPNKGGHLILWDLRLVIRFPPGCSILIPSAILRHSNVAIQQGETRFSFTQYTPAGIFRFIYNNCRTDKALKRTQTQAQRSQRAQDRVNRWSEGLKMYNTWDVPFE